MKTRAFLWLLQRGGPTLTRAVPGLLVWLRRWWWALLLGAVVGLGLMLWLAFTLLLWAWDTLPHLLAYLIHHFAPAFAAMGAGAATATEL